MQIEVVCFCLRQDDSTPPQVSFTCASVFHYYFRRKPSDLPWYHERLHSASVAGRITVTWCMQLHCALGAGHATSQLCRDPDIAASSLPLWHQLLLTGTKSWLTQMCMLPAHHTSFQHGVVMQPLYIMLWKVHDLSQTSARWCSSIMLRMCTMKEDKII